MDHMEGIIQASSRGRPAMIHVWGQTDLGRNRKENQDTFRVSQLTEGGHDAGFSLGPASHPPARGADPSFVLGPRGALFGVADGMGGPAGGGRASRLALTALTRFLERESQWAREATPQGFVELLVRSVKEANWQVHQESREDAALAGMGTTLTLAGLLGSTLYVLQVGDSRAYVLRDGAIVQVTRDQSMVQELLDAGVITVDEARTSPQRNVILKALGTEPGMDPVVTFVEMRRGDLVLLCSDGLSGVLSDDEISRVVAGPGSLQERCRRLVDSANEAGGPDNITVVLAEIAGESLPLPAEGETASPRRLELERPESIPGGFP